MASPLCILLYFNFYLTVKARIRHVKCWIWGPDIVSAEPEITVHEADMHWHAPCHTVFSWSVDVHSPVQVDWDADEFSPQQFDVRLV